MTSDLTGESSVSQRTLTALSSLASSPPRGTSSAPAPSPSRYQRSYRDMKTFISTDSVKSCLSVRSSPEETPGSVYLEILQRHEDLSSAPTRLNHVSVRSSPEETPGSVYLEIYRDWRPLISTDSVKSCLLWDLLLKKTWICLSRDLQRHEDLSSAPTRLNHVSLWDLLLKKHLDLFI